MPVVELGPMGVKPNHSVFDNTTPEGQILEKAWKAVTTLPGGPHWSYGGLENGEQNLLWGFFEFDSIAQHEAFAKTHGAEAVKDLPKILTHSVFMAHVEFSSPLQPVLRAPIVQIVLIYCKPDITEDRKDEVARIVNASTAENIDEHGAEVLAWTSGWSTEKDVPITRDANGKSGLVFAVFIGWPDETVFGASRGKNGHPTLQTRTENIDGVLAVEESVVRSKEFGIRQD